jgi:hypothetical protein
MSARIQTYLFMLLFFLASAGAGANALAQNAPFTVSLSQSALTMYPGTSQVLQVQVSGTSATPVAVVFTGLPTGVTPSPSPLILAPGASGAVTLTAALNADSASFPATAPQNANTHTTAATLTGVAGPNTATAPFSLTISLSNAAFAPTAAQIMLPILRINTSNVAITNKTVDVPGTISITSANGATTYLPGSTDTDNTATFHVHGNTTALMPKLPYHMSLGTSVDLLTLMGLKCPYVTSSGKSTCDKSKSYILLANYDDKTLLRDWSASALANAIPIGNGYLNSPADSPTPSGTSALVPWAPHSLFVELYLNGVYEGNYQLIEEVKVDSHRVNIPELTETQTTGDLTGGYLLEIDQHQDEAFVFDTPEDLPIGLIDPDFSPSPEVPEQTTYISNYVDTAEDALFGSNYTSPTQGWRAYYDEASLVNYYIVNDILGNVDGGDFYSSVYLYKSLDNPLLYMGPIWDFDISSGNVNYEPIVSPDVPWTQTQAIWYKQLFTDPGFKQDVATQWNALKNNGVFIQWLASVSQQASVLNESAQNNYTRWPILGERVWPNAAAQNSYGGEVLYFLDWVYNRMGYLDSQFNNKTMSTTTITSGPTTGVTGGALVYQVQVMENGVPDGSGIVTLLGSGVVLGSGALDANGQTVITGHLAQTGTYSVAAIYGGSTTDGYSASTPSPITITASPVATSTVLTSAGTGVAQGSSFSFTVDVTNQSSAALPTGSVQLIYGGYSLGTAMLTNGSTTFNIPSSVTAANPGGSYLITALYGGDALHTGSTGSETITLTTP